MKQMMPSIYEPPEMPKTAPAKAESNMVCPYRLLFKVKLFSRTRTTEFMDCYGKSCPYYEFDERWDSKPFCRKAEHDYL